MYKAPSMRGERYVEASSNGATIWLLLSSSSTIVSIIPNRPLKRLLEMTWRMYPRCLSILMPPRRNKEQKGKAVRQYIDSIIPDSLFKSVTIIKAESNRGLANSVINGVSEIINRFGRVIVVEDDLVTTPDFLSYMNRALDFYRDDPKIWSISGYSFKMKIPKSYKHDIFLSYRASSWGYATWADRWNTVDWELKDYQQFSKDWKMQHVLNRGGRDLSLMVHDQVEGRIDSWAIRWC